MRTRFRSFVLAVSALCYAFLGGGPSLWALGLSAGASQCSMAGCHCDMARHGGVCTCALGRALLQKYPELANGPGHAEPGRCEMRSVPLQDTDTSDGDYRLPAQQAHTLPAGLIHLQPSPRLAHTSATSVPASFRPEPPTPIPD